MSTKHFLEDTDGVVIDALESLALSNPDLAVDVEQKAIINAKHNSNDHVALISGGGAGHEPAHAAYVGDGLLTAAVSGNIFASPSAFQILSTIRHVGGSAGTVLIVKNYTGDVFNFNLAAQKAHALYGLKVRIVIVGDDVSVGRKQSGKVGRRGLAGTVLVHKILGGMAKSGKSLEEIVQMGQQVSKGLVTIGASLSHVHIPGRQVESVQTLGKDELELGMGIHNEAGCRILSPKPTIDSLIETMTGYLLDQNDADRAFVDFSTSHKPVLLLNNLGGLSVLEFAAITNRVAKILASNGIKPTRIHSGTYMTSLDGPGFSITLLKATPEMIGYLDQTCTGTAWPNACAAESWVNRVPQKITSLDDTKSGIDVSSPELNLNLDAFLVAVSAACRSAISAESRITEYDTIVGDGDCGITLKRGAEAVLSFVSGKSAVLNAITTLTGVATAIETSMDGTSGAIYGLFFNALAAAVRDLAGSGCHKVMDASMWVKAANTAFSALQTTTPARVGDRTIIDALDPFLSTLANDSGAPGQYDLPAAVAASVTGKELTKGMRPAFGRSVYVNESLWEQVPDPGAEGVVALVEGLVKGILSS